MRAVASAALAIALSGCIDKPGESAPGPDAARFVYEVRVAVPDSITAAEVDGEPVTFVMPRAVQLAREWPTYDAGMASDAIELTFFAGDVPVHVGRVKPGVCGSSPAFACPTTTRESIAIYDVSGDSPDGSYLDFDVGTATSFSCEGCGGGFGSSP